MGEVIARQRRPFVARQKAAEIERARCSWLIASDLAAQAFGADVRQVMQTRGTPGRGGDAVTSKARKVAFYLAVVVCNNRQDVLAEAAKIDRKSIAVQLAWVEDQRDRPDFDAQIEALSDTLMRMALAVVMVKFGLDAPAPEAAA